MVTFTGRTLQVSFQFHNTHFMFSNIYIHVAEEQRGSKVSFATQTKRNIPYLIKTDPLGSSNFFISSC